MKHTFATHSKQQQETKVKVSEPNSDAVAVSVDEKMSEDSTWPL